MKAAPTADSGSSSDWVDGWNEALEIARERIMRLPYEIDKGIWIDRDEVINWIDALRRTS